MELVSQVTNGVYFHKNGKNKIFPYKEKQYNFEVGMPVEFFSSILSFVLDLMYDILKMIEEIVYSTEIIQRLKS